MRIAVRIEDGATGANHDHYLFADHLSSTNVSYWSDNYTTIVQHHFPWSTIRPTGANALPTTYTYTGQRVDETIGLMYYGARYYDPAIGRFLSPDTIAPIRATPRRHPRIGGTNARIARAPAAHSRIRVGIRGRQPPTPSCRSRAIRRR